MRREACQAHYAIRVKANTPSITERRCAGVTMATEHGMDDGHRSSVPLVAPNESPTQALDNGSLYVIIELTDGEQNGQIQAGQDRGAARQAQPPPPPGEGQGRAVPEPGRRVS